MGLAADDSTLWVPISMESTISPIVTGDQPGIMFLEGADLRLKNRSFCFRKVSSKTS